MTLNRSRVRPGIALYISALYPNTQLREQENTLGWTIDLFANLWEH
jgi:hypothetical protein